MGGGSNDAQREAQEAEAARQAQIANTQRRINYVYSSPERERDINQFMLAMREYYRQDADRQQGDAGRNLRFAMARGGMTGGSFDADQNRRLGETYQRGLLEAERRAQGATANLRSQDEQSKQNLFALAQSGLDSTTALNQAAQSMRNNIGLAQADARENSLGNLFGSFGDIYQNSVRQSEDRKAQKYVYDTLYQPKNYSFSKGGP